MPDTTAITYHSKPSADPARRVAEACGVPIKAARRVALVLDFKAPAPETRVRLTRPSDVFQEARELHLSRQERMLGFYLDAQNGLLARVELSVGALNTTRTHPREIFWPAIGVNALGLILAHNHPSGASEPSDEDVAFTKAMQRAGELLGVELYDHVIVCGPSSYVSLRERGLM